MQYDEIKIGATVKNLVTLAGLPYGAIGKVIGFYGEEKTTRGITIVWCSPIEFKGIRDGFNESEINNLEFLN